MKDRPEAKERDEEAGKSQVSVTDARRLGGSGLNSTLDDPSTLPDGTVVVTNVDGKITHSMKVGGKYYFHAPKEMTKRMLRERSDLLEAEAKALREEAGKVEVSATEAEEAVKKEVEEVAPLAGLNLTGGESSMRKEAGEGDPLVGPNSAGGESSMRKEAEDNSGKKSRMVMMKSEMQRHSKPVPDFYSSMTPEYREKLMKHIAERAAANKPLLLSGHEKISESSRKRSDNSAGKSCFEMTMETQQYVEVQRALLHFKDKLAKKKSRNMDKETLRLLKDMSNMLDQGGCDGDDSEDTNVGTKVESNKETKKTAIEVDMADEAEKFASYRRLWEYKHGKTCGLFTEPTVLSSMQFTHYTPGRMPFSGDCYAAETLQIISIKLTRLAGGLELPLSVYGVVAVRDTVDRNRNILFFRDSSRAQELKQNDPFLHLIGPSRAVVLTHKTWIEIELRVKGSQDKALMSCAQCYTGWNGPGVSSICFRNVLCTLELLLQPVKQTVQATILGVQVAKDDGSWPFKYGGLVACTPLSGSVMVTDGRLSRKIDSPSSKIVLIESADEALPKAENGYVHLWRQVVSVEGEGRLDVVVQSYSKTGAIAAETRVPFYPKVSNLSQKKCALGGAEVTITVAWSLVAASKIGLALELSGRRFV